LLGLRWQKLRIGHKPEPRNQANKKRPAFEFGGS
jgi:hypothetical protein